MNMRLIDIGKFVVDAPRSSSLEFDAGVLYVLNKLDAVPTVDAVPVVRCKDCIHSYDDLCGLCCTHGVCVDCVVQPEFYCADGKRKQKKKRSK